MRVHVVSNMCCLKIVMIYNITHLENYNYVIIANNNIFHKAVILDIYKNKYGIIQIILEEKSTEITERYVIFLVSKKKQKAIRNIFLLYQYFFFFQNNLYNSIHYLDIYFYIYIYTYNVR